MRKITVVILIFICNVIYSQTRSWENIFSQLITDDENESLSLENTFEILSELEQNPININTATKEELERIPFLNERQIEDISEHIYQYNGMKTLGELSMIESLDPIRQQLLPYFVYIGENNDKKGFPKIKDIAKYGKNDFTGTIKIPFYERKGDKNGYLGYEYNHSIRYTFSYGEYLKIGLTGAQDAGEPFFAGRNNLGYDHYSFYILMRKLGSVKSLVVGRYKLKTGLGLVMNNDFGFGKISTLSSLGRNNNTISGYSSRSDAYYLQGAASTLSLLKNVDLTAFISYRNIDATLNSGDSTIATILKTGYHRTETEMKKKNNSSQFVGGGNLQFDNNGFHVGFTALYTCFDKPLEPKTTQKYRRYYASGDKFWNISADYGYTNRRISLKGETATGDCHALATINKLEFQASRELSFIALQRFYSYKYYSLLAETFSEGGYVQNESGMYIGTEWHPRRNISVMAYTDYAYFPWIKYQVSDASNSWDNYISVSYNIRNITLATRYRIKVREKDNADKTSLIDDITQRARFSLTYDNNLWSTKTQLDFVRNKYKEKSKGWMVSENISCQLWKKIQYNLTASYFNTDDYASCIYMYERGTLYSFYFPSFYGRGIHYSFFVRADISPKLMFIGKLSTTDYFDRDHISSGFQQIDHSSMTDLEFQMRIKF